MEFLTVTQGNSVLDHRSFKEGQVFDVTLSRVKKNLGEGRKSIVILNSVTECEYFLSVVTGAKACNGQKVRSVDVKDAVIFNTDQSKAKIPLMRETLELIQREDPGAPKVVITTLKSSKGVTFF